MQHNDPTQPIPSVFVIGSSTTLLFGPHLQRMLQGFYRYSRKGDEPDALRRAFADLDVPQGASAGDSVMVLDYLEILAQDESFRPDVVLMHVGLHDIRRNRETGEYQVPLETYRQNVEAITAWFQQRQIRQIWLTNGPLNEELHNARSQAFQRFEADLAAYNAVQKTVLHGHGIDILDLAGFTHNLGPIEDLLTDHIHFHEHISQAQAAFIAGYLHRLSEELIR